MLTEQEYKDFIALVKRMREAQIETRVVEMRVRYYEQKRDFIPEDILITHALTLDKEVNLELEVDEYLKKMEV